MTRRSHTPASTRSELCLSCLKEAHIFTITVRYDEKRSTASQYENVAAGVFIERSNLELHTPEELLQKTQELFGLARAAVHRELAQKVSPTSSPEGPHAPPPSSRDNGNGRSGSDGGQNSNGQNGHRRRFGRPDPEPTPKQKALLHRLAKDRKLGPETVREICERICGQPIESLDRKGMGRLLEGLISGDVAA